MLDIEVVDIWKYVNFTNTFDKLKQLNAQMAANVCHSHYLKTLPCHELKTLTHAQKFGLYSVFETDARILQ